MRFILWHVQLGSEAMVTGEHLLVHLTALLFLRNSLVSPHVSKMELFQRGELAKHRPSSVYLSSLENAPPM